MQCSTPSLQRQRLYILRVHHGVLLWLAFAVLATWAAMAWPGPALAQLGEPPCIGMPPLASLPVDAKFPALEVAAAAVPVGTASADASPDRKLRATWSPIAGAAAAEAKCISVAMRRPGQDYESMAIATLAPAATAFEYRPVGVAGEYCFRFVVLAPTSRSAFSERCAQFPAQFPPGPLDSGGEPPAPPDVGSGLGHEDSGLLSNSLWVALGVAGAFATGVTFGPSALRRLFGKRG